MAIIDVRSLFSSIGVEWRDHGPNSSRGNVTIRCPLCGDSDYSGHLKVAEQKEAYFCLRNSSHAGTSLIRLLTAFGYSREQALKLRNSYVSAARPERLIDSRETKQRINMTDQWNKFRSAMDSQRYLDYLQYRRGFPDPVETVRRYDLRFAPHGEWACRLLIPLPEHHAVESWTGRDITDQLDPKYRMAPAVGGMLYLPRGPRSTGVIVEGPLDALKLAVATEADDVFSVALLSKNQLEQQQQYIVGLCDEVKRLVIVMDNDASLSDSLRIVSGLHARLPQCRISRAKPPKGYKDHGAAPIQLIKDWLLTIV